MNKILNESLTGGVDSLLSSLSMESYPERMDSALTELTQATDRLNYLDAMKDKLTEFGMVTHQLSMESFEDAPEGFTAALKQRDYVVALESVEGARSTLFEKIKEIIKKIIAFATDLFKRIFEWIKNLTTREERNKSDLASTQLLLDRAKKKDNGEHVAQEGYSTGTIAVQAPHYLQLEYAKIVSETEGLEYLASSYIKDAIALLTLQFRHCKFVIEAYHRLMSSPDASLEDFDRTCQNTVREGEQRVRDFNLSFKVFNCIEIVEEIKDNEYAGVLRYRASIKPPEKDDLTYDTVRMTTNLMKAQDLQDKLVKLNEEIIKFANEIKKFFAANSRIFLDTLNKLNDSAVKSPTGQFDAHSDYVVQVHSFLVRGNLIQVVMGLNVLNTVWKSIHDLNTRVVKEFLRA